jgi:hypothetical protein
MNIPTLLAKLRPDIVKVLEKQRNTYDLSITDIYNKLEDKHFYSELTMETIKEILLYGDISANDWKNFDWKYGEQLFKN